MALAARLDRTVHPRLQTTSHNGATRGTGEAGRRRPGTPETNHHRTEDQLFKAKINSKIFGGSRLRAGCGLAIFLGFS
jgi:hypothetical protein